MPFGSESEKKLGVTLMVGVQICVAYCRLTMAGTPHDTGSELAGQHALRHSFGCEGI